MARHAGVSPEETRARLLRAGVELFGERGLDGVTTRELAARAGLTLGALHHYFATKEEMYEHVSRAVDDAVTAFVRALTASLDPGAGFEAQLERVTREGWRFARAHHAEVRFRFREWFEGAASAQRMANERQGIERASALVSALSGVAVFDTRVRLFSMMFTAMRLAMASGRELSVVRTLEGSDEDLENALVAMSHRLFVLEAPAPAVEPPEGSADDRRDVTARTVARKKPTRRR